MLRRMVSVLFAAALLLVLGGQAAAVSVEEKGSICVTLQSGIDGTLTLYKVGEPISDGYRLSGAFGGGIVKAEDAHSQVLAQWLAEQAGTDGIPRILDADGNAEFSKLNEGLYLLLQTETEQGYYPIDPFLVTLPYAGVWDVEASPKTENLLEESPKTGEHPAPLLAAMVLIGSSVGLIVCTGRKWRE